MSIWQPLENDIVSYICFEEKLQRNEIDKRLYNYPGF